MEDLVLVHAVDGFQQILGDEGSGLLGEVLVLRDDVVELPIAAQLQQGVEVRFVVEEPIHIDDVGVIQKCLDLELADELLQDIILDDLLFLQDLDRHDEP